MSIEGFLDRPLLRNARTVAATANAAIFFVLAAIGLSSSAIMAASVMVKRPILVQFAAVLAATSTAMLVMAVSQRMRSDTPPQYKILSLEGTLEIALEDDHRRYVYCRSQRVEAIRNEMRLVEMREHWTGRGETPRVELLEPPDGELFAAKRHETDNRAYRWVYAGRPLKRGQRLLVSVRQEHTDSKEYPQLPYFRQGGGRYATERITVRVRFPEDHDPGIEAVSGAEWDTANGQRQTEYKILTCERSKIDNRKMVEYSIEVKSPTRHHSYGLLWTWPSS